MDSTLKDTLEKVQRVITDQTLNCSTIARQIAFGLTAATWALLYIEGKFDGSMLLLLAISFEIIYFVIDFMQYFMLTVKYRKVFNGAREVILFLEKQRGVKPTNSTMNDGTQDKCLITDEQLTLSIQVAQSEANRLSFIFFYFKFLFIVMSFAMVLLFVLSKL